MPGVTKEYGEYLGLMCSLCHGVNMSGGPVPGGEPPSSVAPNITPGGAPGSWSQAQFVQTIRTGITPAGNVLNSIDMPWPRFGLMTDDELAAIWLYLESLPAREFEG